jgi:hypothetical protein
MLLRDFPAAASAATAALAAARSFGARLAESEALVQLAAVAADDSSLRWTEAERAYTTVLERAGRLGARPLVAHCQLGLGGLYARVRSIERARECLGVAATMYADMRMAEWLRRANGELAALA